MGRNDETVRLVAITTYNTTYVWAVFANEDLTIWFFDFLQQTNFISIVVLFIQSAFVNLCILSEFNFFFFYFRRIGRFLYTCILLCCVVIFSSPRHSWTTHIYHYLNGCSTRFFANYFTNSVQCSWNRTELCLTQKNWEILIGNCRELAGLFLHSVPTHMYCMDVCVCSKCLSTVYIIWTGSSTAFRHIY